MTIAEELRQEGEVIGEQRGLKKGVEQVARRMLRQGLDENLILIYTQLSREALARLKDELN